MHSRLVVVVALLLVACSGLAAPRPSYDIEAELDPVSHRVRGRQVIRWWNLSREATTELRFHLYLNAFASSATTFMRELGGGSLRTPVAPDMDWGSVAIARMVDGDGVDLLPRLEFIRPDDANPDDFTVARVVLDEPLPPGAGVVVEMDFTAELPSIVARTGHAGDFHMVGQWYPKLGVLEEDGWSCHQYHANSEYYADFADYDVRLTVPAGWVVGGSGIETRRHTLADGRDRVQYRAERVHDFAWCAAPPELMTVAEAEFDPTLHVPLAWVERAARDLGRSPAELELPPMYLRFIVPSDQVELVPRMITATRLAVAWLGLNLGPYPYPQLTVVSPPPLAHEAWGMEYPTLITTGASRLMTTAPFARAGWIESVTAHELGHQYFQGLVATNEAEAAWLDEGLTSWAEVRCREAMAEAGFLPVGGLSPWAAERVAAAGRGLPVRPDRPSWEFRRRIDYFRASYARTAVTVRTLEGLLGRATVARGLRAYVDRHRFGHPRAEDLFAALEAAAGTDLDWFFAQTLRGDAEVDWAVLAVRNRRPRATRGLTWDGAAWQESQRSEEEVVDDQRPHLIEVELGRRGDLTGPVEVRLRFADGREQWRRWAGRERWVRWRFESPSPLVEVVVDPRAVWALEGRRADNYWRSAEAPGPAAGHLWWLRRLASNVLMGTLPWL